MTRSLVGPAVFSAAVVGSLLASCGAPPADANGRFEATEVTVSAEASGALLELTAAEGDAVDARMMLGRIDTMQLSLQRQELDAQAEVLSARRQEAAAQGRALGAQLAAAQNNLARTQRLLNAGAATSQMLERDQRDVATLTDQQQASRAAGEAIGHQLSAIAAQRAQLRDRMERTVLYSPITGTVLTRFVEPGELVQAGRPVLTVASLDSLVLRAYLAEEQLSQFTLGQMVTVQVDDGVGGLRTMPGRITWIARSAEFTPTPIQTREERVSQVYAVKVVVANPDGALRIGMPGELVHDSVPPPATRE